jgi:hypothetical protein
MLLPLPCQTIKVWKHEKKISKERRKTEKELLFYSSFTKSEINTLIKALTDISDKINQSVAFIV